MLILPMEIIVEVNECPNVKKYFNPQHTRKKNIFKNIFSFVGVYVKNFSSLTFALGNQPISHLLIVWLFPIASFFFFVREKK